MSKRIGRPDIIGEQGIAHIRRTVLDMGYVFYKTGGVEADIDGYIELRDPNTGEVGNLPPGGNFRLRSFSLLCLRSQPWRSRTLPFCFRVFRQTAMGLDGSVTLLNSAHNKSPGPLGSRRSETSCHVCMADAGIVTLSKKRPFSIMARRG